MCYFPKPSHILIFLELMPITYWVILKMVVIVYKMTFTNRFCNVKFIIFHAYKVV